MKTKTCNCCGKQHTQIPQDARYDSQFPAYYWECSCRSTLAYFFVDIQEIRIEIKTMKEARASA